MHWFEKRRGWLVREASHGRQLTTTTSHSDDHVALSLTHFSSEGIAIETKVVQCMTVAEAQIFAAALDKVGHPAGTKIDDLLFGNCFREAPRFSGLSAAEQDP